MMCRASFGAADIGYSKKPDNIISNRTEGGVVLFRPGVSRGERGVSLRLDGSGLWWALMFGCR